MFIFDRALNGELTKCAVLGIDMLLLLGICQAKMEFNALQDLYFLLRFSNGQTKEKVVQIL